jgi:hypothetical protein
MADSANVVQYSDNGTPDHLWTILPADDPQLFFDDFEDQSTASWSSASGSWSICEPATFEYCAAPSRESVALTGDAAWRSYTVDALVRLDNPAPGASAGLVARAQDSAHYYVAEIARRPDGTQAWDISRNDGGTLTQLAAGAFPWVSSASRQVALRFRVQGGYLSVGVVSESGAVQTLGEVFDTTYAGGQAGLRARAAGASFDAVRIGAG